MNQLTDGLEWLNRPDTSHLSAAMRERLSWIMNPREDPQAVFDAIDQVMQDARSSADPLEQPEALVYCAVAVFYRGRLNTARGYLQEVVRLYDGSIHRQAVARWMLGFVEWSMFERELAVKNWQAAHEAIQSLVSWYQELDGSMNADAKFARANSFAEAIRWLNEFEPSHLSAESREVVDMINRSIDAAEQRGEAELNTRAVSQLMEKLQAGTEESEDYLETAEAFLECGYSAYRMRHYVEAIRCLRLSARGYHPFTHQQAVARWALGIVQWEMEPYWSEAQANWEQAIDIMEELAINARYQNLDERWEWYNDTIETMRNALHERMKQLSV